jgi:hypothetical protein
MRLIRSIQTNFALAGLFTLALCGVFAPIASAQQDGLTVPLAQSSSKTFQLLPNPKFLTCLAKSPAKTPTATVVVTEGNLNDTLTLTVKNVKPNLGFDLFTVENTSLNADGTANIDFDGNFGLAWYQSDVQANGSGTAKVTIHTILVSQIFGFDTGASLAPTHTFHVGFWFDSPDEVTACATVAPTPFNGEQDAGPLAMISVTDPGTGLGPLCFTATDGVCDD